MAFFGLTALGPQNSFESASTSFRNLQIFDEEDFREAWEKVNKKNTPHCHKSKIGDILRALFHGPIPINDREPLECAFSDSFETPETISLDSFLKIMIKLRDEAEMGQRSLEGKVKPGCEFVSSNDFKDSLKRSSAMKREIQTKQTAPITSTQEVICNTICLIYVVTLLFFL
jgi:hypothetical protein